MKELLKFVLFHFEREYFLCERHSDSVDILEGLAIDFLLRGTHYGGYYNQLTKAYPYKFLGVSLIIKT